MSKVSKARRLLGRRKRSSRTLSPLKAFESAFTMSLVPMLIADRFGQVVEANENATKQVRMRRNVLLRKKLDDIFELPPPAPGGSIQTRLLGGEILDVEVHVQQKDAAPVRLRLRGNGL